jgi:cytosol alanyl aminopeptidase
MLGRYLGAAAVVICIGCPAGGDLVMAPPTKVHSSFRVDIPPPRDDGRLPAGVEPRGYRLDLALDPRADRFEGEALIGVTVAAPTSAIVLHGAGLEIDRAQVVVGERRIRAEPSYRKAAGATQQEEELVLVTSSEVPAGEAKIHLFYRGPLGTALRGIYRAEDGDAAYLFTQFEPSDARRMFPCFDDPAFKVPFEIAVTAPADDGVFANTPETEASELSDGRVRHVFAKSKPMPTYLVALAVGPFEVLEGPQAPVPLRVVAGRGKARLGKSALEMAQAQLAILGDYFGQPYPYEKLDLVAVPNFGPGAMENAGLVTFREELLLLDDKTASTKARRDVAQILAHELAHQWFGNLVTMKWWDDLWLNEGFATFMEEHVVSRHQPQLGVDLEALSLTGWVMDFDALPSARQVRQPVRNTYEAEEAFDGITYVKGASVIRMLERWLGEEPFRDGVRQYLAQHRWGSATAEDMFTALSRTSNRDVGAVATTFLDQPGVPLVRAKLACDGAPRVELSQRQYHGRPGADASGRRWSIPVCVAYGGQKSGRACTLLDTESATLPLDEKRCPRWILPNADYAGYYRYALTSEALAALGEATRTGRAIDKVGYLSNLWALVQAGEVPAATLLDELIAYKRERDRAVLEEVIKILDHVDDALIDEATRPRFRELVTALLMPTAKRLGWDPRPGESEDDRLLRRAVLEAMALKTDDAWMATEAKKRALDYLADTASVDGDVATIALRLAAHRGDVRFRALSEALAAAKNPARRVALVQALASLGDRNDLTQALGLVANGAIRAQDALYVARVVVAWPESRTIFIEWLGDHLPMLAERIPGFGLARMMSTLRRICDAGERTAAEAVFEPHLPKIGSDRRFREAIEHAGLCIDLRGRQAAAVQRYFATTRTF